MRKRSEVDHIEEFAHIAPFCGGTIASAALRQALEIRKRCPAKDRKRVDAVIEQWRTTLAHHNAQDRPFTRYDMQTGEPIDE